MYMYKIKLFKVFLFLLIFSSFSLLSLTSSAFATTTLTYEYDANGNLISGDGKYYEYNDANQLVRVRHRDQNGPVIAEYFYDYTGQRIKKIEDGVTTYYIGKHYETQIAGENQTNTSYYFANGERVAKKDQSGNLFFYHLDHLGGTNAITDYMGNLIERTRYYPFGEIRLGGNEKYSFTGKEKDKLTDNYYFEARYYNPEFKHFTQADTFGPNLYDPQDLNRYAYVRNNPVKYIDPSGLFFFELFVWKNAKTFLHYANIMAELINVDYHYTDKVVRRRDNSNPIIQYVNMMTYRGGPSRGGTSDFPRGYCTWYVAQTYNVTWTGNANTWKIEAEIQGYSTGDIPKVGAILVSNEGNFGHVSVVAKVYEDGSIDVRESNYHSDLQESKEDRHIDAVKVKRITEGTRYGFIYTEDSEDLNAKN
jgi:RHS repeat-associated protein